MSPCSDLTLRPRGTTPSNASLWRRPSPNHTSPSQAHSPTPRSACARRQSKQHQQPDGPRLLTLASVSPPRIVRAQGGHPAGLNHPHPCTPVPRPARTSLAAPSGYITHPSGSIAQSAVVVDPHPPTKPAASMADTTTWLITGCANPISPSCLSSKR